MISSTSPGPTVYTYDLSSAQGPSIVKAIQTHLRTPQYFRTALPFYRRLQFGHFHATSRLITNVPLEGETSPAIPQEWIYAFVDRSCRPETEVWVAASWEVESSSSPSTQEGGNGTTPTSSPQQEALVLEVVRATKALGVPPSVHQPTLKEPENENVDHVGLSSKDYGGHMANANIMLWGAVHERTAMIMKKKLDVLGEGFSATLMSNHMFIFDVERMAVTRELPAGLRWGELRLEHFELVRSRTSIPRQDRTLAMLPSLAIFTEGEERPVAWAFVGLDASLTTLHVEEDYRGRGLAKAVTTKLFKEKMGEFYEEHGLGTLAHGYVITGNGPSAGMCKSLGGKDDWEVYWLRVDLGKIQ